MRMVVVLPEPLGPRKPKIVPRFTCMERSRTTCRPPKDLVRPCTSMTISGVATAAIGGIGGRGVHRDASGFSASLRRRHGRPLRHQRHVDRLADAKLLGLVRQRLDEKDELGALLEAVDHRRREFGLLAMKLMCAVRSPAQPSQPTLISSP